MGGRWEALLLIVWVGGKIRGGSGGAKVVGGMDCLRERREEVRGNCRGAVVHIEEIQGFEGRAALVGGKED